MEKNLKNINKIMNALLQFHDKNLERTYNMDLMGYQNNYLKFFSIAGILVGFVAWITNPNQANKFEGNFLVFNLISLAFYASLSVYLFKRKTPRYVQTTLLLLQTGQCVGFIEAARGYEAQLKTYNLIIFTVVLEIVMLIPMISRCHWKFNTISSFLINIYANFRYISAYNDSDQATIYSSSLLTTNFLIISLGSYINEKYDRKLYYLNKINEKSLRKYEFIVREVFPSAIIIHIQGKIVFHNRKTLELLGIDSDEAIEEKINNIILRNISKKKQSTALIQDRFSDCENDQKNEGDYLKSTKMLSQILNEGNLASSFENYTVELHKNLNSNEEHAKILELKICKIIWEGEEAILSIMTEDFSTQKIKYLSEQTKYKDHLLATVSHDLRTPLNGIIGVLEVSLEDIIDESLRKNLMITLRSSKLLLYMINDILDFSQISEGKLSLNPIEFCITGIAEEVSKLIKFQAKRKGLKFIFQNNYPSMMNNITIFNDPNRIKQVILNLLSNALKFTQNGYIKLSIEPVNCVDSLKPHQPCRISVEDTGLGIKKEELPRLFRLFGKLQNSETSNVNPSGVGLGLAISQNLVKYLNKNAPEEESIQVISEYGKGSTFSFLIYPMKQEETCAVKGQSFYEIDKHLIFTDSEYEEHVYPKGKVLVSLISQSEKFCKQKKRILLVDDDQINVTVLKTYFKSFDDCEYDVVFHGEDALNLVKKKSVENYFYDIIFMDCNMPVMDGFEASKKILELVESGLIPKIKIIASTANISKTDLERCLASGMIDYIAKPFSQADIRKKLNTWS